MRGVSLSVAGTSLVMLWEKCLVTLELFFSFESFAMGMWLLWGLFCSPDKWGFLDLFLCNLWCRDEENFCATVPKDGRSYSPMLFAQTVRVLKKINKPGNMIVSFSNLAERIKVSTGGTKK